MLNPCTDSQMFFADALSNHADHQTFGVRSLNAKKIYQTFTKKATLWKTPAFHMLFFLTDMK